MELRPIKIKGKLAILLIPSKPIYQGRYKRYNLIEYEDGTMRYCQDEEIEYLENEVEE